MIKTDMLTLYTTSVMQKPKGNKIMVEKGSKTRSLLKQTQRSSLRQNPRGRRLTSAFRPLSCSDTKA